MVKIIGYADQISAKSGIKVNVMVSTPEDTYNASLVRLLSAPDVNNNYALSVEHIDVDGLGRFPGRVQNTRCGSFAIFPLPDDAFLTGEISLTCWIFPTLLHSQRPQTIFAINDLIELKLSSTGFLELRVGDAICVTTSSVEIRHWYAVVAQCTSQSGTLAVCRYDNEASFSNAEIVITSANVSISSPNRLILATSNANEQHFNGKIENPRLYSRVMTHSELQVFLADPDQGIWDRSSIVGEWDFNRDLHLDVAVDVSGNANHGRLINGPMRGCTGHLWNGTAQKPEDNTSHYGSVHFHDDDLQDAEWESDFSLVLPPTLSSGVYAIKLSVPGHEDYIPFFVTPQRPTHQVLFLAPTNTYIAYANEQFADLGLQSQMGHELELNHYDRFLQENPELGKSIYDLHHDGSGVAYSSRMRPIINLRPHYRTWLNGGPRHLAADLYIIGWLETQGVGYDVTTDEDLHRDGIACLDKYDVLVTGSHPEYWTRRMLDSLRDWLSQGGRLMYLGGNGFYWVTGMSLASPHVIEVRRGFAGTRSWDSSPGELYLSTTGDLGGLWRYAGCVPQSLVGVGFTAEGWGTACGYRRLDASYEGYGAELFEGIDEDIVGDFGYVMGGAVGDEVDRLDFALGTPANVHWLATSVGLDNTYHKVIEDLLFTQDGTGGKENKDVRADMVVFETGNGGKVFSVGSINYAAALAWNNYQNNISKLTTNVLKNFLNI